MPWEGKGKGKGKERKGKERKEKGIQNVSTDAKDVSDFVCARPIEMCGGVVTDPLLL